MFETGQPDTGMRVLIKGTPRLSRRDGLGRTQLPVELTDGQFLGETAQLTGTPALADGHAVTDIEALLIPPHGIRALLVAEVLLVSNQARTRSRIQRRAYLRYRRSRRWAGGLATAVYAASEGLSVVVFDQHGPGGQAGASARIENYFGFPAGITSHDLAARAFVQAVKFGAEIAIRASIKTLDYKRTPFRLELTDGQRVSSHAVIATGAAYRRPAIEGLEHINSCGIYHWASSIGAKLCAGA